MTTKRASCGPETRQCEVDRVAHIRPRLAWLSVVVPVLMAGAPADRGHPELLHCIRRPGPEADSLQQSLSLLNGVVTDSVVARDVVALVETICWDKAERMFGVRVSLVVVSVWTEPSPLVVLRDDLQRLVQAQRRHRDQHGAFADLTQLEGFELSPRVAVDLSMGSGSVRAVGRHNQLDYLCLVEVSGSKGAAEATPDRQPVCESQHGRGPWGTLR